MQYLYNAPLQIWYKICKYLEAVHLVGWFGFKTILLNLILVLDKVRRSHLRLHLWWDKINMTKHKKDKWKVQKKYERSIIPQNLIKWKNWDITLWEIRKNQESNIAAKNYAVIKVKAVKDKKVSSMLCFREVKVFCHCYNLRPDLGPDVTQKSASAYASCHVHFNRASVKAR